MAPPRSALLAVALLAPGCGAGAEVRGGPPPIVLVSMDTLRPDRLGAYGNPRGLTPNLDAFAAEAVVFDHAYSQATQTAPSHASLFTSRYPSEQTGADHQPLLTGAHPTLAQLLSVYDYQTGAFVAGADLSRHRGLVTGFAAYETSADFGSLWHTGPLALGWLDTVDRARPWFLFVHGYDTHSRYLKPTPYGYLHADAAYDGVGQTAVRTATERVIDGEVYADFDGLMRSFGLLLRPRAPEVRAEFTRLLASGAEGARVDDADVAHIRGVYDGAVSYADAMFGVMLAGMESRGVLDDAVILVMSDHGEQLGEHGLFGHCCGVEDEESRVVLMARMPRGAGGGRRVAGFVELVDVLPTVAELTGAAPPAGIRGRSFAAALRGEPFEGRPYAHTQGSDMMRMVSVRGPRGRLTYTGLYAASPWLPDIVDAARLEGPGFTVSAGTPDDARGPMRAEMAAWLRTLDPPPDVEVPEMPAALRKSLRDHGYWDLQP